MKSITNILLVAALVCYVFLPFYNIPLAPSSPTGFDFTAGMITGNFGWSGALFALVPLWQVLPQLHLTAPRAAGGA